MMQMGDMGDVNPTHINDILDYHPEQQHHQQRNSFEKQHTSPSLLSSSLSSSSSLPSSSLSLRWSDDEGGGEEEKFSTGEMVCWKCLEGGEEDSSFHLIAPCLCRGDNQFIHRDCLDKWRAASDDPDSYYRCKNCDCVYRCEEYFPRKEEISQCRLVWGIIVEIFGIIFVWQLLLVGLMGVTLIIDPDQVRNDFFPPWSQGAIDYCSGLILFAILLFFWGVGLVGTNNQEGVFHLNMNPFGEKDISGEEREDKKPKTKTKVFLLIFVSFVLVTCGAIMMILESITFFFISYLKRIEEELRYQSALTQPVVDLKRVPKRKYPSLQKMRPKELYFLNHRFKLE